VWGICGGLQMLGRRIVDPAGVEGPPSVGEPGLGLLDLDTHFDAHKRLTATTACFASDLACPNPARPGLPTPWQALAGVTVDGYEIRHGRTLACPEVPREGSADGCHVLRPALHDAQGQAIGWQQGSVLGVYLHGLFEQPAAMRALFGQHAPDLNAVFDGLADFLDQHMHPGTLMGLLKPSPLSPSTPP
jgi:adenosylcobyric acid synthase